MLIPLLNKKYSWFEKDAQIKSSSFKQKFSEEEMEMYLIANLFVLFIAGFDTSSTIMTIAIYFLAKNPDIQDKLLEEIDGEPLLRRQAQAAVEEAPLHTEFGRRSC